MTTNIFDSKNLHFQNLIVVTSPTKNSVFGRFSSLPPRPPPSKANILFYCRLAVSDLRCVQLAGCFGNVILANSELTAIDRLQVTN